MNRSEPLTLPFSEVAPGQLTLVGGKGLNLGRLSSAGFPVPPGFVVTTSAYAGRDHPEIAEAIGAAYGRMGEGPVAVRSSATAEDLEGVSFAGQQETFLNVRGSEAVFEAVRACWASLHSERAVAYRRAQGIPDHGVAMAVVVQRMVAATSAGVLFTRDPSDSTAGRMLVEGAWGLGEAVVSGKVNPDRWTLDRTGRVRESRLSAKPIELTSEGEKPVPPERRSAPCLTASQLVELARLGERVEAEYGAPQDIEWAFAGEALYLLQSRPITAMGEERQAVRQEEIARLRRRAEPDGTVWSRYSLAEVLPEPLPFTWSVWRRFMRGGGGYGRMYRELGFDPDPGLDEDGILDLIAGRPYFNLSRDARIYFRNFPNDYPFAKLKANPELAIYPKPEANLARAPKGFLLKMIGVTRQMLAAERTLDRASDEVPRALRETWFPRLRRFVAEADAQDLSHLSTGDLARLAGEYYEFLFDQFASQSLKPSLLAGLAIQKLESELKPAVGEGAASLVEQALAGLTPGPEYDLANALRSYSSGSLTREEFLTGFGHRGPGEMELAQPRWRETPERVPRGGAGAVPDGTVDPWEPIETALRAKRLDPKKARKYLERTRELTRLREVAKHELMRGYEALRSVLLELDRRSTLAGGIFYLELSELGELAAGRDFRSEIAIRRRRRMLALGLEAPRVLFSDDLEAIGRPEPVPAAAEVLHGTGVSAGAAEGPALVLRSPDQAPEDARDFILVCPSTDPGWVPLFLRARGLVLETGGVLSHGAIVAREFGLPAVANIGNACSRIPNGARLRVDGTTGTVRLSPQSPVTAGRK